jgi:type I restriction enzyme S subunit
MKSLASNFGHLQFHDEQVRRLGMLAERYFAEDPKKTSLERFRDFPVPMAPLPEPQEIVRRVEALFAFADRIEARLATAQKTVERLTPATLAKAFRGELVPQDPNDEPASALLNRLSTSTPSAPVKSRRAGKRRGPKP